MLKRLIPDTVAGRTLLVLVFGLAVSHVLSMALYFTDRTTALLLTGGEHIADRVATIGRIIEKSPPSDRGRIIQLAEDSRLQIRLTGESAIDSQLTDGWQTRILRSKLQSHLDSAKQQTFRLRYLDPEAVTTNAAPGFEDAHVIEVSLQLSDGSWLNFTAPVYPTDPLLSLRFVLSTVVMLAAVVILSAMVVHHLVAPLRTFASAAERLGVDVNVPALPESGPREVRRATHAFNEMQQRIRRFVEDRTQMLAAISHDLRTPIMRLRLRAELIDDQDERERALSDLDEMERMIASTLSFARDDAVDQARETVDLMALVQRVCDSLEDTGLKVEFDSQGRRAYACRASALRRALSNLIENAARYGEKARVELLVDDRRIVIRIDDHGPGIPEDQIENVFRPFHRLEVSRSRETGGAGLGLTVARTIVRAHGGDVHLTNRPEGGLRVEVILPH